MTTPTDAILKAIKIEEDNRGHDKWIPLASLRETAGLTRRDFDTALIDLYNTRDDIMIEPEVHRHRITPAQKEAALKIGGEPRHLLQVYR